MLNLASYNFASISLFIEFSNSISYEVVLTIEIRWDSGLISQPTKSLFNIFDSTATVPDPENKSPIKSPSLVNAFIKELGMAGISLP